jgi:tetratricopeptide (TPR) repeat protein
MSLVRAIFIFLILSGVGATPSDAFAKEAKKPKVSELMKDANDLMSQAQTTYVDGDSKKAIELYRKALAEIARVEDEHPAEVATAQFAPVRFRKALCETEIDRIMLEDVNATSRTVAVTDTTVLEAKRAERKRLAETNRVAETMVTLGVKQGLGGSQEVEPEEDIPAETKPSETKTAETQADEKPLNIKEELEWAKDMLSVERFGDVEKALFKVLRKEPENRDARFLMALARVQQGKPAEAVVVIDDLLADNASDEPTLLLAAGAYAAMGNYSKAMDALDKAMKVNPKRPDGYHNMAWLLLEMKPKDSSEAEMYYRQAIKLGGTRDRDIERLLGIKAE